MIDQMIKIIKEVNPGRSLDNVDRRLMKVLEELGECSEAYLSVSSPHNYKSKSWEDYREEAIDTLIVLIDIALTQIGNVDDLNIEIFDITTGHNFDSQMISRDFFAIAGHVRDAAYNLRGDSVYFYQAIHQGIASAIRLCFTVIPNDQSAEEMNTRVFEIFERKISKWQAAQARYAAIKDGK